MKIIENIKDWVYNLKQMYTQSKQDKKERKRFLNTIKEESSDRNSFLNTNNLRTLDNYSKVVKIIDIPEEYQTKGQQWQIMDKLNENSFIVSRYLREVLEFGNNITTPEYYHIEDPSNDIPFSCRYVAIWTFTPILSSKKQIYIINTVINIIVAIIISCITYFILV